jgi:hypothetical protein
MRQNANCKLLHMFCAWQTRTLQRACMRLIFIPALQLGNLSDTHDGRISLDAVSSDVAAEMRKMRRMHNTASPPPPRA